MAPLLEGTKNGIGEDSSIIIFFKTNCLPSVAKKYHSYGQTDSLKKSSRKYLKHIAHEKGQSAGANKDTFTTVEY